MILAFCLQARAAMRAASSCHTRDGFRGELVELLWLAGNIMWACAELLFEGPDCGRFAGVPALRYLDATVGLYPATLGIAVALMCSACAMLLMGVYRWREIWPRQLVRCKKPEGVGEEKAVAEIVTDTCGDVVRFRRADRTSEGSKGIQDLPELFGDTFWLICNWRETLGLSTHGLLPIVAWLATIGAVKIQADRVVRIRRKHAPRSEESMLAMVDFLWVSGNFLWMFEDLLPVVPKSGLLRFICSGLPMASLILLGTSLLTVVSMPLSPIRHCATLVNGFGISPLSHFKTARPTAAKRSITVMEPRRRKCTMRRAGAAAATVVVARSLSAGGLVRISMRSGAPLAPSRIF